MPKHRARLYLLVSAVMLVATVAVTPQTRTLAITRVSVVDVIDGRIVPNSIVTIRGETISSVSQNGARSRRCTGHRRSG